MMLDFHVIIPARYASTRLATKLIQDLGGKPLMQHTYERAVQSRPTAVWIALDDERLHTVAQQFGAQTLFTAVTHQNGTERLAEVAEKMQYPDNTILVNLQADEPFIPPAVIRQVAQNLHDNPTFSMATLCEPLRDPAEVLNSHVTKVIFNDEKRAIYFSRSVLPGAREGAAVVERRTADGAYYRHIGIYAYRCGFLKQYVQWKPCDLETHESLEQLRAIWYGAPIHVDLAVESVPIGIDTPADLERARQLLALSIS